MKMMCLCASYEKKYENVFCILKIPDPDFLPIPDPGVKKALNPGSAATLLVCFCGGGGEST